MYGFVKEFAEGIFAPEEVRLLTDAFDDAWSKVQASKAPWATDDYAQVGRTILAKHIITNAQSGEFDPRWLADSALLHLTQHKLTRKLPSGTP
jgi:hypothetical protein